MNGVRTRKVIPLQMCGCLQISVDIRQNNQYTVNMHKKQIRNAAVHLCSKNFS